jgi:hypothetical protein
MNRVLLFGIAMFFAVVGIALIGGDSQALAGHSNSCCGCNGNVGCDGGCGGYQSCNGCSGRRHHRKNKNRGCCGQ